MSSKRLPNSPLEKLEQKKKCNMPKRCSDPQADGTRIIVEAYGINDQEFFGSLRDEELMYIWQKIFNKSTDDIFGMKTKRLMARHFRAIFVLNGNISLSDFYSKSNFVYRRRRPDASSDDDYDNIHCRLIGFDRVRPAEIGQLVRITASTVDFTVAPKDIVAWLSKFGSVNTNPEYVKNALGIRTDVIEVDLLLKAHIPEYLPVAGKKAQINYAGIKKTCINCYKECHLKRNCRSRKVEWIDKVDAMRKSALYEDSLFGEWTTIIDSARQTE